MQPAAPLTPFQRAIAALPRLPSQCAVCRSWGHGRVCTACVERHAVAADRCRRCAIEVPAAVPVCGACLKAPPPFEHAVAAVAYDHPWDGLIAQFKFHDALDLAPALAERLVAALQRSDAPRPALVLAAPLAAERSRERGYNQAWELARRAARALGLPADARLLRRVRDTPHQIALPPGRRAANVRGAYAVDVRRAPRLAGRRVAVVDDVMTTGATAAEMARTLLRAGAAAVDVWVVARTPRPDGA